MSLADVDTPALIVDLDAFERNLRRLPELLAGRDVALRPHAKTHKAPIIARRQMALGAVGVCCQKVGEAEKMVQGGVTDVFVSNEIVGATKLRRLAQLAISARIATCVDDAGQVDALNQAARAFGVKLGILIEVDVGRRCGVAAGDAVAALADKVADSSHLELRGLQAYHGSAQHLRTPAERRAAVDGAIAAAEISRAALTKRGLPCPVVSGGGTGTFELEAASGVYNELQCGSYIFMDADYARNLDADGNPVATFEQSLYVWATVMSRPSDDRAILDAGHKAASIDSGYPLVPEVPGAKIVHMSDEHAKIELERPVNSLRIGDKIRLVPGHCDPTVNLHDWYVAVRAGKVEALWMIAARGAMT